MRAFCTIFLLSIWIGLGEPFCFRYDPNNPWCGRPVSYDLPSDVGPDWCSRNPTHPMCQPPPQRPCNTFEDGGSNCLPPITLPDMCNDKFTFGRPCKPPVSGPFPCNSKFTDGCKKAKPYLPPNEVDGRSSDTMCNDKFTFGKPCKKPIGAGNSPSCNANFKFGCPNQGLGGRGGIFDIFGNANFKKSYKGKYGHENQEASEFQETNYQNGHKIVRAGQKGTHEFADYEPYKSIGFNFG